MRVNGGFLAGLDVELERGLNVVIGARGSGKTTLLELIRHALGVANADDDRQAKQKSAIAQMLGSGEVILELQGENASLHLVVDASGSGRSIEADGVALALGQNELESIASTAASRLNLIDMRASVDSTPPDLEEISRLTEKIDLLRQEADLNEEGEAREAHLIEERRDATAREQELLAASGGTLAVRREELRTIDAELLDLSAQIESTAKTLAEARELRASLEPLAEGLAGLGAGTTSLQVRTVLSSRLPELRENQARLSSSLEELVREVDQIGNELESRRDALRIKAEPVRAELEAAESGLGQLTARIRNLDSELAQLARARERAETRRAERLELIVQRDAKLDDYESWQESVYEAREGVARSVSANLATRVVVEVQHMADSADFKRTLEGLLTGSGLQYRSLSETIASRVLPRQLLRIVEEGDVATLAELSGLSSERTARVVGFLSDSGAVAEIAKSYLQDRVDFLLSDNDGNKNVEVLSTGQKCAVTLPIILTEPTRVLLLDQPEDHLDNAYLVRHVVTTLLGRDAESAQTIVATHNANIPVLGSAKQVIELKGEGDRGRVQTTGSFDAATVVKSITDLMEGGKEAFERRAEFYVKHGAIDG